MRRQTAGGDGALPALRHAGMEPGGGDGGARLSRYAAARPPRIGPDRRGGLYGDLRYRRARHADGLLQAVRRAALGRLCGARHRAVLHPDRAAALVPRAAGRGLRPGRPRGDRAVCALHLSQDRRTLVLELCLPGHPGELRALYGDDLSAQIHPGREAVHLRRLSDPARGLHGARGVFRAYQLRYGDVPLESLLPYVLRRGGPVPVDRGDDPRAAAGSRKRSAC